MKVILKMAAMIALLVPQGVLAKEIHSCKSVGIQPGIVIYVHQEGDNYFADFQLFDSTTPVGDRKVPLASRVIDKSNPHFPKAIESLATDSGLETLKQATSYRSFIVKSKASGKDYVVLLAFYNDDKFIDRVVMFPGTGVIAGCEGSYNAPEQEIDLGR